MDECATYLGQKGYSIFKSSITVKEQQYLREELNVQPYVPKAPCQPNAFPVYRESKTKIYEVMKDTLEPVQPYREY